MKVAVLLSGCGVYDGSEIQESVFTLLALSKNNIDYVCVASDKKKHHIINHTDGEEMKEERNMLIESSRISRGEVVSIDKLDVGNISALVIPGGFGVAKNFSDWAFKDVACTVDNDIETLILHFLNNKKPIVSLCISPVIVAKVFNSFFNQSLNLTLGSKNEDSDYDIIELHSNLYKLGVATHDKNLDEICFDSNFNVISAPCYMLKGNPNQIYLNVQKAIDKLANLLNRN